MVTGAARDNSATIVNFDALFMFANSISPILLESWLTGALFYTTVPFANLTEAIPNSHFYLIKNKTFF